MNRRRFVAWVPLLALAVPASAPGLPWDKDMVDQPAVKPQETTVRATPGSVPAGHVEPVRKPHDLADLVQLRLRAAALENPEPATPESVERGKTMYDTHCLVCHGASGEGNGPIGEKMVPPPMNLTVDYVRLQPDGQIFFTITHGGIVMPFYRDAIAPADRWHLVNYLRKAFGGS